MAERPNVDDQTEQEETAAQEDSKAQVEALIDQATEAIAAGQVGKALRLARRATEVAPDVPAAWALLATIAEEAGDYREALRAYRETLRLDPDRPGIQERIEELSAMVAAVEERAEQAPAPSPLDRYAPIFLAASVALLVLAVGLAFVAKSKRVASSEQQYKRVMELGKDYMARQEYDRAEAAFSDALRIKPNDASAQEWLRRAQQGRQMLAKIQQWNYETAGGKFPGQQGTLPPAQITPTRQRRQQEQQRQASAAPRRQRSSWTPRRYEWQQPSTAANYPSPRREFGPPEYAPTTPPGTWGPVPPAATQPPSPIGAPGTMGAASVPQPQAAPATSGTTSPAGNNASAASSSSQAAPEKPRGYLRIVVGEPKAAPQKSATSTGPSADEIRDRADQLRRAGRLEEAKRLYQQAIELYRKEAQADPTARAVKEAGIESCRRALEQCEQP